MFLKGCFLVTVALVMLTITNGQDDEYDYDEIRKSLASVDISTDDEVIEVVTKKSKVDKPPKSNDDDLTSLRLTLNSSTVRILLS